MTTLVIGTSAIVQRTAENIAAWTDYVMSIPMTTISLPNITAPSWKNISIKVNQWAAHAQRLEEQVMQQCYQAWRNTPTWFSSFQAPTEPDKAFYARQQAFDTHDGASSMSKALIRAPMLDSSPIDGWAFFAKRALAAMLFWKISTRLYRWWNKTSYHNAIQTGMPVVNLPNLPPGFAVYAVPIPGDGKPPSWTPLYQEGQPVSYHPHKTQACSYQAEETLTKPAQSTQIKTPFYDWRAYGQ